MTDSTEQGASTTATEQQGVKLPNGYTRLPNGVILDKEGKPHALDVTQSSVSCPVLNTQANLHLLITDAVAAHQRRSSWTLLHSIAATFPEAPSRAQQGDLVSFVQLFSRLYPCWVKLGKPIFDCDKWQERWVTGPKDGSCD
uniref:thiol oxidase n=1 Tax=Bionectria ochroleuca TaxID=29856 RepID=A0A0B7JU86_BIOOC